MGLRNILTDDDPALRKVSREIINFDGRLHNLLDDLAETVVRSEGAGLAAPQIGILRSVCILNIDDEEILEQINPRPFFNGGMLELVNPRLTFSGGGEHEGAEGCLSVPNRTGWVKRPNRVIVEAQDRYGRPIVFEGEEFVARILCHELDHLNGILYTDVMERFLTAEEIAELEEDDAPTPARRRRKRKRR
jgi:peptide deformylase